MPDLVYLIITLASFAALALLTGLIDRRLAGPHSEEPESEDRELTGVGW